MVRKEFHMVGIIGAMQQEVAGIIEAMESVTETKKASMVFYSGCINSKSVIVVKSGVGKVNAAICTQILIDDYGVDCIINTGAAGSLSKEVGIGDVVIATEAVQHDMKAEDFGYPSGQVPFMDVLAFPTDKGLQDLAVACYQKINPEGTLVLGRVVTGDEFVARKERKDWIIEHFGGYCTEMEGAAIAQAAYANKVPCLIVRAISDEADDSAEMSFDEFSKMASERSIQLILEMLNRIK